MKFCEHNSHEILICTYHKHQDNSEQWEILHAKIHNFGYYVENRARGFPREKIAGNYSNVKCCCDDVEKDQKLPTPWNMNKHEEKVKKRRKEKQEVKSEDKNESP